MSSPLNTHDPLSLTKGYLGPYIPKGMDRVVVPYGSNRAAAYVPPLFQGNQERCPPITEKLIVALRDDLQNHFEYRIQVFLQQLLLVYKTGLTFDFYAKADFQVGEGASKEKAHYVAAHSSTLPTLRLTPTEGKSLSFGRDTFFYNTWNATVYLPEVANQIDSAIDRSTGTDKGCSIREFATDLLNEVSRGKAPAEGLTEFLRTVLRTVRSLRENEKNERRLVLDQYLEIGNHYWGKLTKEFLIQQLCFQDTKIRVNEQFYQTVQAPMHRLLAKELIAPVSIPSLLPLKKIDWILIRNKLWETALLLEGRAVQYKNLCLLSDKVKAASFQWLSSFSSEEALKKINGLISSSSLEGVEIYKEVRKEIAEKCKVSSPKNLPAIIVHLLIALSDASSPTQSPVAEDEEKRHEGAASSTAVDLPTARTEIQNKIKANNLRLSAQGIKYQKLCKAATKVQAAVEACLGFLAQSPALCREQELEKICSIKTSKSIERVGLSERCLVMYQLALAEIRKSGSVKEPQHMSTLLMHLLGSAPSNT